MTKELNGMDVEADALPTIDLEAGRRAFIKNLGLGAVGASIFGAAEMGATAANAAVNDFDILNFALNLEYLEAEFYLRAVSGQGLSDGDRGANAGQVTGGSKVPFKDPVVQAYAKEIAADELNHVRFLRAALGTKAVSEPPINVGTAFAAAAKAAGVDNGENFSPYADDISFLLGAYIFEDVGVTAYHGAAALISNKTYLDKAAGILAVEAYHAGIVRAALFAQRNTKLVLTTQQISRLRSMLSTGSAGGARADDYGIGNVTNPTLVIVDGNSIAFDRTTRQVLNIVYGKAGAPNGLFFPSGMNGTITK